MNENITGVFDVASRVDVLKQCKLVADVIKKSLLDPKRDNKKPILIGVPNRYQDSADEKHRCVWKSLLWDVIPQYLFEGACYPVFPEGVVGERQRILKGHPASEDTRKSVIETRHFGSLEGHIEHCGGERKLIRVFYANMSNIQTENHPKRYPHKQFKDAVGFKSLGDVIIISKCDLYSKDLPIPLNEFDLFISLPDISLLFQPSPDKIMVHIPKGSVLQC